MKWTPHPLLPIPSDEEFAAMDAEEIIAYHRLHHETINKAALDPYRYGFRLPHWKKAEEALEEVNEILALGGNRSGKTAWGAYCVVRAAIENPGAEIFCFSQTAEVSIRQQQKAVWEWLPPELKSKTTSSSTYISYTQKNGFAEGSLILPNKSQIIFKTYSAYSNNPTILEGAELGSHTPTWVNIGIWLDEYLSSPDLIETVRFRLATRNAKMLVTFTPIDGWTEVVRDYLDGAETVESRKAELLGGETVPYVQRSKKRDASIHYFHSQDNPFGGYDRIKHDLTNESREVILVRAYGVPTKSYATKFPKFSTSVNVVPASAIPKEKVTWYQVIDPAGAKNWFMSWIAVDGTGCFWVAREWPGVNVGDWAEPGREGKWKPGQGAKGLGYGLIDYIELIQQIEAELGIEVHERLIDPRYAQIKYQERERESCLLSDLDDLDFIVKAAPGDHIEDGLQKIVDLMAYDTSKPIDAGNRPHFYVSEDCENIIRALAEYTGEEGLKDAWKDPIDTIRYAAAYGADHLEEGSLQSTTYGSGGY